MPDPGEPPDLFAPETAAEPFGAYAWLRRNAPVFELEERGLWAVSRYEDVREAALDHRSFTSAGANGERPREVPVLVGLDPPDHGALRARTAPSFSPAALRHWPSRLEQLATDHVGRLARRDGDVVALLAEPLSCAVFEELLGTRRDALARLRSGRGIGLRPAAAYARLFTEVVSPEHRDGDGLIAALAAAGLDEDQLRDLCLLLLSAGIDTSRDLIANMVVELARNPSQWDRLSAGRELLPSAVEEVLRFTSPIQAMYRTCPAPRTLAGVEIPAGARVMLLFGSANRDDRRWPDADVFDVARFASGERDVLGHVAFGAGPHACLGAWFGRQIGLAVLRELLDRGCRPALTGEVTRGRNPAFRRVVAARVTLTP
jgi:cytochrome P450